MFTANHLTAYPAIVPRWSKITEGDGLTVSLDDVKDFVNRPREDTFWDVEYTSFIKVARLEIERACQFTLAATTFKATLPCFFDRIRLIKRPFVSVETIEYVEAQTGEIKTVDPALYHALPVDQDTGMVFLGDGLSWPTAANRYDAVRITLKAGYGVTTPENTAGHPPISEDIKHALLMTIASLETTKGDNAQGGGGQTTVYAMKNARGGSIIPPEARTLLAPYRYLSVTL